MPHLITQRQQNFAEMAFRGLQPWHGLGQQVRSGASLDEWRKAAGLDWEILRSPVKFEHGSLRTFRAHDVLYRNDNSMPISIVSPRYRIVQPREALAFFEDLVTSAGFEIETAGSLAGGKRIWVLARTGFAGEVVPSDDVTGYLLLATSYDGNMATIAQFTSVRVVCANTLQLVLNGDTSCSVRIRHSTEFEADKVKDALGIAAKDAWDLFMKRMQILANLRLTSSDFGDVVRDLIRPRVSPDKRKIVDDTDGFKKIMALFNGHGRGSLLDGCRETAWGGINAITQWVDHEVAARSRENRLTSAWFGAGARLKEEATLKLLELAGQ
ncbi:DUF932 domain-containing protein [Burkholderia sp. Ac-20365]|uniref:DUF932 domain-containing protein n=1 Tax=Burkholderia sp. Ac-20365 TaxID=2703897 RepID=UPI00197B70CE|nr:DUF932 domain-containing protein [Burkholderia sp. Ac-20365]MBN3760946.1 DUF932 domain-containing protein [Burkholderia sp. Ac-20365]